MRLGIPGPRQSAAVLSVLLCLLVILSTSSPVPTIPISSVQGLDEGTEVKVVGVVADMRRYDSGTESLILVDLTDGCSIGIYCIEDLGTRPSDYAKVGDELVVLGTVVRSDGLASLLSCPSQVALSRASEYVLTTDLLSSNWASFLGDDITVRGRIIQCPQSDEVRLSDEPGNTSISLRSDSVALLFYADSDVVLAGELKMDSSEFSLFISVDWVRPQE